MKSSYKIETVLGNLHIENKWKSYAEAKEYIDGLEKGWKQIGNILFNQNVQAVQWKENGQEHYGYFSPNIAYIFKIVKE